MTRPTRRDVMRNALLGFGAATLPVWAQQAFAGTVDRPAALLAAYRQGAEQGRPVLVIVVPDPEGPQDGFERGRVLGAMLNHGDDAAMSLLGWPVLACATAEDVATLVPDAHVKPETWLLRIDTDAVPSTTATFDGPPPIADVEDYSDWDGHDRVLEERLAWLTEGLRGLILPDRSLPQRYRAQLVRTEPGPVDRLEARLNAGERPTAHDIEHYAAVVVEATLRSKGERRAELASRLADYARATWVEAPVPGSWWARSGGCGITFENEEDNMRVGCGMGHVPAKAVRMLHFYGPRT